MTTIAYKNGIIAYDSRAAAGAYIVTDNCNKRLTKNGIDFFMCGSTADRKTFFKSYFGDKSIPKDCDVSGLIIESGEISRFGVHEGKIFECPLSLKEPAAMGSGTDHAITAMDMGASAREAVKMAMKRDSNSGGRIRTHRLK